MQESCARFPAGEGQDLGTMRSWLDSRVRIVWAKCEAGTDSSDHLGVNAHDPLEARACPNTAERWVKLAAGNWTRYAAHAASNQLTHEHSRTLNI
jgi:hypothetical protein